MSRVYLLLPCTVALVLGSAACEKKKTAAQLRAEQQKAWQAQQKVRAAKYYQEIIDKYPDSPYVAEAKQRLQAMGPIATPKPGAKPPAKK